MLRNQCRLISKIEGEGSHSAAVKLAKSSLVAAYSSKNISLPKSLRAPCLEQPEMPEEDGGRKEAPKSLSSVVVKPTSSQKKQRSPSPPPPPLAPTKKKESSRRKTDNRKKRPSRRSSPPPPPNSPPPPPSPRVSRRVVVDKDATSEAPLLSEIWRDMVARGISPLATSGQRRDIGVLDLHAPSDL